MPTLIIAPKAKGKTENNNTALLPLEQLERDQVFLKRHPSIAA
jgi:hypothetical protein